VDLQIGFDALLEFERCGALRVDAGLRDSGWSLGLARGGVVTGAGADVD